MLFAITAVLINTPLQRGASDGQRVETVSTVSTRRKTVETVFGRATSPGTPLKRGVNEILKQPSPEYLT
jgi:hypothetical protein